MDSAAEDDGVDDGDVDEVLDARLSRVQASRDPREWADLGVDLCDEWRLEEATACLQTAVQLGCEEATFDLGRALGLQDPAGGGGSGLPAGHRRRGDRGDREPGGGLAAAGGS